MTTLDPFETALLARLREEVGHPQPRRPGRRWLGGAAAGLAAAAGATFVLWPAPAWAVDGRANGDVEVTIRSFEDVDGLRRALAAEGVDAVVEHLDQESWERAAEADDRPKPPACQVISRFRAEIGGGQATYVIPAAGASSDAVLHIAHGGDLGDADGESGRAHRSWIAVWWEGGPCPAQA